jgi:hypothetical protein
VAKDDTVVKVPAPLCLVIRGQKRLLGIIRLAVWRSVKELASVTGETAALCGVVLADAPGFGRNRTNVRRHHGETSSGGFHVTLTMSLSSTATLKGQLINALGVNARPYFDALSHFVSGRTSRAEFEQVTKHVLSSANLCDSMSSFERPSRLICF